MNEYFTVESLLSFAGSVLGTVLIPTVVLVLGGEAVKRYVPWIALAVAYALAYLGAFLSADPAWVKYVVAAFNGALLFLAAVGANKLTTLGTDRTPLDLPPGEGWDVQRSPWVQDWF